VLSVEKNTKLMLMVGEQEPALSPVQRNLFIYNKGYIVNYLEKNKRRRGKVLNWYLQNTLCLGIGINVMSIEQSN